MKYTRFSALALAGALTLSLAACSSKKPNPSEVPSPSPVESGAPSPTPTPEGGPVTADGKVAAAWEAIANTMELPALVDLDDDLLSSLYYLDASLLEGYVAKIPAMNVHATEFFIARVKEGNMETVKAAAEKRQADLQAQWSQYLPDQLALVEDYKLVESGDYLLFCVSDDSDAIVAAFEKAVAEGGEDTAVLAPTPVAETTPTPTAAPTPAPTAPATVEPVETPAQESPEAQPTAPTAQSVYTSVAAAGGISGFVDTSFALDAYYSLTEGDLADYALYQPDMSTSLQEVFVARAAQGKLETVKAACQSRQQGLKEEAEFYTDTGSYIDSYQLVTQGDWVLLYIGPNADAAASAFQSAVK